MCGKYNLIEQDSYCNPFAWYRRKIDTSFKEIEWFYENIFVDAKNGKMANTQWSICWWKTWETLTNFKEEQGPKLKKAELNLINSYCDFVWQKVLQFDNQYLFFL